MKAVKIFHILIEGRVQGVGYRRFTANHAEKLGLSGHVRNLMDGRVEAFIAVEDETQLKSLLEHLRKGPVFGKVRDLKYSDVTQNHPEGLKTSAAPFVILPDEEPPK